MSTTYPIAPELELDEYSSRFVLTSTANEPGGQTVLSDLTPADVARIAFKLLEVVSYFDPGFEETKGQASSYVLGELRRMLG